jgi:hypothetical protein
MEDARCTHAIHAEEQVDAKDAKVLEKSPWGFFLRPRRCATGVVVWGDVVNVMELVKCHILIRILTE